MQLYLVRHGQAAPSNLDPSQGLTNEGIKQIEKVCSKLPEMNIQEIWHSGKNRAFQTAEIIQKRLSLSCPLIKKEGLNPEDPVEPIFENINIENLDVMIVGHLPFLERLLFALLVNDPIKSAVPFHNSTIVSLQREKLIWSINWVANP